MFTRTTITIDTVRRMARVARVRDARATGGLIRVALRSGWSFPAPADPRVAYVATPKDAVRIVCDAIPVDEAGDLAA